MKMRGRKADCEAGEARRGVWFLWLVGCGWGGADAIAIGGIFCVGGQLELVAMAGICC